MNVPETPFETHSITGETTEPEAEYQTENPEEKDFPKEKAMVEFIFSPIESEGYAVSRTYGGEEAIDRALTELPDAIILDLNMPLIFRVLKL
ncbi:sensory transduction histidine kinase [Methanosarcina horonobensis HB-1 = JCM 15518]|uniref:Sensory transduction histidine kinase n=1 Tax=Methanosarcina horonobensis HB-1 = JCM 15518 TaxID=1434110 RepID=A0A0E3SF09_9EURY|nr:response regulator [Methanosarcina horonobensis]AKB78822.1 sensory transduction histidine kinase [Methanosarcina horonobensis HB-1 = JCM 15518]